MKTAKYEFFYGTQTTEFERPEVPGIIAKKGIKTNIKPSKTKTNIKPSKTKAVILNVCDKAE